MPSWLASDRVKRKVTRSLYATISQEVGVHGDRESFRVPRSQISSDE
ncbi:MAG TPA: hypothetical protein VKA15_09445 [Isosphaeraceae bacterium]|nr:hypothetical protein [Isosphaeraceae bacterium]